MARLTPRSFGTLVVDTTVVPAGTLLTTPFTLVDGSVVTLLARHVKQSIVLSDWGMTADFCEAHGRTWETVSEKLQPTALAHSDLIVEGREIMSRPQRGKLQWAVGAMVQAILGLTSYLLLPKEAAEAAFAAKVDRAIRSYLGEKYSVERDWNDDAHDPYRAFVVDYRINGVMPPAHIFTVGTASKIPRVTATSLFYRSHGIKVPAIVILNEELRLGPKQQERLQVACEKFVWNIDREAEDLPQTLKRLVG